MYQILAIFVMQVLQVWYLIKYRPFKSELQQVIVVTDEFTIIIGLIFLFFMFRHQDSIFKSLKITYMILGVICLSLIKNIGTIFYLTITSSYIKFRQWLHKKLIGDKPVKRERRLKKLPRKPKYEQQDHSYRQLIQPAPAQTQNEMLKRKRRRRKIDLSHRLNKHTSALQATDIDKTEHNKKQVNRRKNKNSVSHKVCLI